MVILVHLVTLRATNNLIFTFGKTYLCHILLSRSWRIRSRGIIENEILLLSNSRNVANCRIWHTQSRSSTTIRTCVVVNSRSICCRLWHCVRVNHWMIRVLPLMLLQLLSMKKLILNLLMQATYSCACPLNRGLSKISSLLVLLT